MARAVFSADLIPIKVTNNGKIVVKTTTTD